MFNSFNASATHIKGEDTEVPDRWESGVCIQNPSPFPEIHFAACEKRMPLGTDKCLHASSCHKTDRMRHMPATNQVLNESHTVPLSRGTCKVGPGDSPFAPCSHSPPFSVLLCPKSGPPPLWTPSPRIPCALASGWDHPKGSTGRRSKGKRRERLGIASVSS